MPSNEITVRPAMPIAEIERLADAVAKSKLFGLVTKEQALTLMAIAQAEGRHPALAARDYHIIQNTPAKKADSMLRDFLQSGGKVEWHQLDDTAAEATFSHPAGGSVKLRWDMDRAEMAGLGTKDMWKKYPRQMLRSRVVSEGVRTVCPAATGGMYVPEEVMEFDSHDRIAPPAKIEPPQSVKAELDAFAGDLETGELTGRDALHEAAMQSAYEGTAKFMAFYHSLKAEDKAAVKSMPETWLDIAAQHDKERQEKERASFNDTFGEPLSAAEREASGSF